MLFPTEGIFDAARLTERGASAVAMLSSNAKHMATWLRIVRASRPTVAICDTGPAGSAMAKLAHSVRQMPDDFDFGDAPCDFLDALLVRYALPARRNKA